MPKPKRDLPWTNCIDGWYYANWYDAAARRTRRLSLRTRDPEQASARFAAFLNEGRDVYKPADGPKDLTCGIALDQYFREHVERDCVDQVRIRSKIKNLKAHFDTIPVSRVSIETSRDYVEARRKGRIAKPAGDGTIHGELITLTAAFNHAVKWKRLKADEVPFVEKPAPPPPKDRYLSRAELVRLFEAAEQAPLRVRAFCYLAYYTAARRRALETLTWFQVDEERGRIQLNPQGRAQTNKRRPVVPIDPAIKPLLRELREAFPDSEYVLGSTSPVWYPFTKVVERAGLEDVTPHTMRHTRATHLLQQGVSPWAVAGLLGDTLTTVIRVYGTHCPDFLAETLSGAGEVEESAR